MPQFARLAMARNALQSISIAELSDFVQVSDNSRKDR